jgi:hypothetical protein
MAEFVSGAISIHSCKQLSAQWILDDLLHACQQLIDRVFGHYWHHNESTRAAWSLVLAVLVMTDKATQVIEWCIQPHMLPTAVKVKEAVRWAAEPVVLLVPAHIISRCI